MQQQLTLKLLPSEAADAAAITAYISKTTGVVITGITGYNIVKQSIDARGRQPFINLTIRAYINEPFAVREPKVFTFKDVSKAGKKVIIVGAGPTGLFAALRLMEDGIRPVILERGKDVRARRRDLAALNKSGIINPDSNYCFGEGGAGTYSDGKLYTRSSKRGDINRILNLFVQFGADEKILYEAHPHIGTNKLPDIITAIRQCITDHGGLFLFDKKVTDFVIEDNDIKGVTTADGNTFCGDAVILATGHSARDIFSLLHAKKVFIEAKSFALGVRVEHPQNIIDSIQYHANERNSCLPPASYSLVQQVNGKGVFSFCMCPGGIIAPASTNAGELVVNGWSPSKRNNPFANSGIVVSCEHQDVIKTQEFKTFLQANQLANNSPLAMMYFQQMVEQKAYAAGGGNFTAPAQRLVDFTTNTLSAVLPACSYIPGISAADMRTVLPSFIHSGLQEAFKAFSSKMRGYYTNDAVVVAIESRTSSPVRIPRNNATFQHPQIKNLYPCGEGAGYAGGIVSAAMDGEKVASMIAIIGR